ncbi:hypothetical protein ACQUKI_18370 [Ralstonia pseudosolanacearum]
MRSASPLIILVPEGKIQGKLPTISLRLDQAVGGDQRAAVVELGTLEAAAVASGRYKVVRREL